jgi:hypothetical protein
MKRISHAVAAASLGALFVLSPVVQARGQGAATPTIDQVLDKAVTALGGRAAMEKVTSRTGTGTIEIPDAGMSGSIQVYEKAPNMNAVVIDLGGMQIRQAFDGTVAWEDNPQTGMREKTGVELAEAKREATFNPELKMKQLYPKMTVRGREKVGASDAWVVDAVPAEGSPVVFFFDVESGLPVRMDATRDTPQGAIQVQAFLEDYRAIDGVKVAHVLRQVTPMFTMTMRLTEVKHNVTLDDKMFKKPGGQ